MLIKYLKDVIINLTDFPDKAFIRVEPKIEDESSELTIAATDFKVLKFQVTRGGTVSMAWIDKNFEEKIMQLAKHNIILPPTSGPAKMIVQYLNVYYGDLLESEYCNTHLLSRIDYDHYPLDLKERIMQSTIFLSHAAYKNFKEDFSGYGMQ